MRDLFSIQPPSHRPDQTRRRLLSLAAMAAMMAGLSRTAWAQEPGKVARTLRSLRIWWETVTREPDAGDEEAKDNERFVSPARPDPHAWSDGGITVAWIGHSTFLINLEGTTILTDPVFSEKIGISLLGLSTVGLRRFVPPALTIPALPPLDLILLSHAHMDHYDIPSLRRLPRGVPVILARDNTEFLDGLGFTRTQELDWGQTAEVAGVRIEAVPAKHWGRRYPWDRDRGYNGLLLTKHKRSILFGGDTAYTERLPAAMHGRPLDVAVLPIGGYNPYIANHASPEQAWDLWRELRARYLVPMHWRTFRMSHERPFEPYERLASAGNGSARRIALHAIGETWRLPG
ncbi:MAG: MBL fold metallo-hydrolase [candidate division NC10 bacterium]|nr:MBL fold metallo-hydrolase [candidate division NC10 bacterium]